MEGFLNINLASVTCTVFLFFGWFMRFGMSGNNAELCNSTDSFEVKVLIEAAKELGKPDWNCTDDPCSKRPGCWFSNSSKRLPPSFSEVNCSCQDGKYRISTISFKAQDLSGVLPRSLSKLPYLQLIDLARNLLSGSIPREWASMKNLTYLSVMTNNLSGPIPVYLGSITSLTYLSFESNRFSGAVPTEFRHLVNLQSLILTDNNLTGPLPGELKSLNNLEELRLSNNNFKGPLPDYFGSWTKLETLEIQGSGFDGPIPPSISLLHNVNELRISDLSGNGSKFPLLQNLTNLNRLVLRSCNISGPIPDYIAKNLSLDLLDLSFNSLEGQIPSGPKGYWGVKHMYLMHNMLTGQVPDWILKNPNRFKAIDLSYNLLNEISTPYSCGIDNINLFRSFKGGNDLESTQCIKEYNSCPNVLYSMHINCGGENTTIGKITYDQDTQPGGAAKLGHTGVWGFCTSGDYWNVHDSSDYTVRDLTPAPKDLKLYLQARISATSLTYYGLCLARGRYRVTLHFSEIVFASNKLTRRMSWSYNIKINPNDNLTG